MPPAVAAALFAEVPRLARAVADATGCDAVKIVQNNGKLSGQTVFHLHVHIIPVYDVAETRDDSTAAKLAGSKKRDGTGKKLGPADAEVLMSAIKARL